MSTPQTQDSGRGYKLSFIINCTVGGFLLLLAIIGFVLELTIPTLQDGGFVWGFLPAAVVCLTIGVIHRQKYLSLFFNLFAISLRHRRNTLI